MPSLNGKNLGGNWLKGSNRLRRRMCISQSTYLRVAELLYNYHSTVWPLNPAWKKRIYTSWCVNLYEERQYLLHTQTYTLNFLEKQ